MSSRLLMSAIAAVWAFRPEQIRTTKSDDIGSTHVNAIK
ncbi:hypothetical protein J2Y48_005076 [Mycoplana sp. BE70]|nr:hypothetical protein [Mycoplana sp. BE70]